MEITSLPEDEDAVAVDPTRALGSFVGAGQMGCGLEFWLMA